MATVDSMIHFLTSEQLGSLYSLLPIAFFTITPKVSVASLVRTVTLYIYEL